MTLEKLGGLMEKLAEFTVTGFEKLEREIVTINDRLDGIDSRLTNIGTEQAETNRRLASLEKKQLGTILSLDETVHRNEFNKVVQRVEVLEKR